MKCGRGIKRKLRNRKFLLIFVNVAVAAVIFLLCLHYVREQAKKTEITARDNFVTTVSSIQNSARGVLLDQQGKVNDWAKYISSQNFTMEEAVSFLASENSQSGFMGHIISYQTMQGMSSDPKADGDNTVDYSPYTGMIEVLSGDGQGEALLQEEKNGDKVHVTRSYTNPVDAMPVVGFYQNVSVKSGDAGESEALLIRVVPLQYLEGRFRFPAGYEKGELSLIDDEGNYIIRSKSLKNENFWEFLRSYNGIGYNGAEKAKEEYYSGKQLVGSYRNANGLECWFACLPSDGDKIHYIGYMPAVISEGTDITLMLIVLAGVLLIIAIDGGYILYQNRRLKEAAAETGRANMAKTQFLSSMSHDIRTPMNAIIGLTTIAARHLHDPDQLLDCLHKITLASNHLLTLVNDVLDISKVESGKMSLNPSVFSLSESFSELAEVVRPQVHEKELNFEIHTRGIKYEHIYSDELRINQIFINLLSNAVKYTKAGGSVTVDLSESEVPEDRSKVVLTYSVKDTGIGMSPEFMKTMYNAFTRAVDSRIDKIQGSGLGLTITKQMVDLLGGTIGCESTVGKGTTFTVTLTLPKAENLTDDMMLPPMRILVADDDPAFLDTANEVLISLGIHADLCSSGAETVDMVHQMHEKGGEYKVIILDWMMPDQDGVETTRQIRRIAGSDVTIIIVSSYDWSAIEDAALGAGVNGFINKPLFRSTLYRKMNDLFHFDNHEERGEEDDGGDLKGMHVLVAEDNDLNWEIMKEMLSFSFVEAQRAADGQECVELVRKASESGKRYDLILMDVRMPVMNGLDAARQIRRMDDPYARTIPIIAMTADAFAEDVQECLDAGMDGHVAKPVNMKKLFQEMRRACRSGKKGG